MDLPVISGTGAEYPGPGAARPLPVVPGPRPARTATVIEGPGLLADEATLQSFEMGAAGLDLAAAPVGLPDIHHKRNI